MKSNKPTNPLTDDIPFTAKLPDGRTLFALVPARWCELDVTGEVLFKPKAVAFLDRLQVMAMKLPKEPTPGFIRTLREALGLTQAQLGERLGVEKMTVYRWERGMVKPGAAARKALDRVRKEAGRKGIVLAA